MGFNSAFKGLNWLNQCQGLCWWDDVFHLYGRNCAALLQWASVWPTQWHTVLSLKCSAPY